MTVYFDANRKMSSSDIQGGQLVGKDEYDSWMAQQQTQG
jgi:hypothetical protein